jgi:hypothetical protein
MDVTGEVDYTIQQPGDHWFWDKSHPYLNASQLFNTWLHGARFYTEICTSAGCLPALPSILTHTAKGSRTGKEPRCVLSLTSIAIHPDSHR